MNENTEPLAPLSDARVRELSNLARCGPDVVSLAREVAQSRARIAALEAEHNEALRVRDLAREELAFARQNESASNRERDAVTILLRAKTNDADWAKYPDSLREAVESEYAKLRAELAILRMVIGGYHATLREIALALNLPADAAPDAVLAAVTKSFETWRCFHCGFETSDASEAEAHFGERDDAEEFTPTCTWWAKLTTEERAQEFQDLRRELNAEQDECGSLLQKVEGLEYRVESQESEIASRFKGCRSIDEVWHKYDSMEGLALVGQELRSGASEALGLDALSDNAAVLAAVKEAAVKGAKA